MKKQKDNFSLPLFFSIFILTILFEGYIWYISNYKFIGFWDTTISILIFFFLPPIAALGITTLIKEV